MRGLAGARLCQTYSDIPECSCSWLSTAAPLADTRGLVEVVPGVGQMGPWKGSQGRSQPFHFPSHKSAARAGQEKFWVVASPPSQSCTFWLSALV